MTRRQVLRILDANLNRSREGLRVCEEIARFVLEDAPLTRALKKARHALSKEIGRLPVGVSELLAARDVARDVGKGPSPLESGRTGAWDLFSANIERAKESLRVLEEASKILDKDSAARFKALRFKIYAIEKKSLPKLETLRHHRPRCAQSRVD
ncbi:MAG: thiamine-phosphate pyrophosphorylase [Candidatus Omnitrophica bacterium]|nr:thiamine-phosphate pyrophosphorylase [Candidatus Omnitrophota bacterium]